MPLSVEEGFPLRTLTVGVQALPLRKLLGAIARLTGGKWHKSEQGYHLQAQPLEKWQQLLLESGEVDFEGYGVESQFTPEQLQALRDLELAVADEVTPQQMTEQGLPFSILSQDLQQQVQQTMRLAAADALIRSYNNAFVFAGSNARVRLWRYSSSEWHVRLLDAANYVSLVNTLALIPSYQLKTSTSQRIPKQRLPRFSRERNALSFAACCTFNKSIYSGRSISSIGYHSAVGGPAVPGL